MEQKLVILVENFMAEGTFSGTQNYSNQLFN